MTISILWPTFSFALTAGPTAPEATNFEPIDTTDMVNLLTGDLAYGVPLLEVPGPSGSYPLSLSYHAGIQPNLESSWVGLGWTLNAGSISRLVNGYADDHKEANVTDHFYWNGGSKTYYNLGITVPTSSATVTAGLTFSQKANGGFSVNPYLQGSTMILPGVGLQASSNGSASLNTQLFDVLSTGEFNFKVGETTNINVSKKGIALSKPFLGGFASLDVSINSKQIKPRLSVAGMSKDVSREGKVNREQKTRGVTLPVPLPFGAVGFLNLSRTQVRTWINETANVNTNGSLYFPTTKPDYSYMNARAFDTYDLYTNGFEPGKDLDPEKDLSGSFSDYDHYAVNAQGLSGTIRPYHFYEYLYRQNRNYDGSPILRSVPMGVSNNKPGFRFVNDFSNRFLFEPGTPTHASPGMTMNFPTGNITAGLNGEGYSNNILAGSRHTVYFTNNEILNNLGGIIPKGFVDCSSAGFTRSGIGNLGDQIGSFKITNESGVTYHFSLPVYSYDEYTRTEKIVDPNGTYQEVTKNSKYAHSWMLTAITGPDYVDRGGTNNAPNGKIDDADWGYWVEFGYRKWVDDYMWRNPAVGFNKDMDNNFQTYSVGKKQIYYLDYVRTASHIALFEKTLKSDGKGVVSSSGGFAVTSKSTAKLDNIYILSYKDFGSIGGFPILGDVPTNKTNIVNKSIRSIKLSYNYELCPVTDNSFDIPITAKKGKLTLNSLKFLGNQGVDMMPPVVFSYDVKSPKVAQVFLSKSGTPPQYKFYLNNSNFEIGDIVKFYKGGTLYYGVITNINPTNYMHDLQIVDGNESTLTDGNTTITETKNPPYNKDKFDMWQMYKSDFVVGGTNKSRLTTAVSSEGVDVWSLRSVKTILGSEIMIDYETDFYEDIVLSQNEYDPTIRNQKAIRIKDATKLNSSQLKIIFYNDGNNLNDLFTINEKIALTLISAYRSQDLSFISYGCTSCPSFGHAYHKSFDGKGIISSINTSEYSITINAADLISALSSPTVTVMDYKTICATTGEPLSCYYNTSNWPSFIAGGVAFSTNNQNYGGGIRVKEISTENFNKRQITRYTYLHGVTSYEPVMMPPVELNSYYNGVSASLRATELAEITTLHNQAVLSRYSKIFNVAREVPSPGVMYKEVESRSFSSDESGEYQFPIWQKFTFQTFTDNMVKYSQPQIVSASSLPASPQYNISGLDYHRYRTAWASLDDLTAAVGNIKSISTYDANGSPIETTSYSYLEDNYLANLGSNGFTNYGNAVGNSYQSQGIIKESFADARVFKSYTKTNGTAVRELAAITSKKRNYPSILISQTHKNHKTGVESSTEILGFDFFSGEDTRTAYKDGYGNTLLHEVQPAYKKYPGMGLPINLGGGMNMLSQAAAEYTYKVDPTNYNAKLGLVTSNVQTWSNEVPVLNVGHEGIWRKHRAYVFVGDENIAIDQKDGLYPIANFSEFNFWQTNQVPPSTWLKTGEATLYDIFSHTLEMSDANNRKAASKFSLDQKQLFSTASNTRYDEFGYSGAEDFPMANQSGYHSFGGGVYALSTPSLSPTAHTGSQSLIASSANGKGFIFSLVPTAGQTYHVSVWSNNAASTIKYQLNSSAVATASATSRRAGTWYLIEADIVLSGSYDLLNVWCEGTPGVALFDDFRVHPLTAPMIAYVYDKWGEVSHVLDNNNLYTEYRYDGMGRLKETYKETFQTNYGNAGVVKVSEVEYNYGRDKNYSNFPVTITTSHSGPSGSITPLGPFTVPFKGSTSISLNESCPNQYALQSIFVDGKLYPASTGLITLSGGTKMRISNSVITLENISASHKVKAVFGATTDYTGQGYFVCETFSNGMCYTGNVLYYAYDACGTAFLSSPPFGLEPPACTNPPESNCPAY